MPNILPSRFSTRPLPGLLAQTVLCLLLLTTAPALKADEQESLQHALEYQEQGDMRAAIIEFKNAVKQDPNSAEPRLLLGRAYLQQGDGAGAAKELERAQQLAGSPSEQLKVDLGRAYLQAGDYRKVLDRIDPESTASPAVRAQLWAQRGKAFEALERLDDARDGYQQALTLRPRLTDALLGMARVALTQRNAVQAADYLSRALADAPEDPRIWIMRGELDFQRKRLKDAERNYQTALGYAPESNLALKGLALTLITAGDYDAAAKTTKRLRAAHPGYLENDFLDAAIAYHHRRYEEARDLLNQVLRLAPGHLSAVILMAVTSYALGEYEQARLFAQRALNIDPGLRTAMDIKVAAELKLGSGRDALRTIDGQLTRRPEDRLLLALAAKTALEVGEQDRARELMTRLQATKPEGPLQTATKAFDQGNVKESVESLNEYLTRSQAQTLSPQVRSVLSLLGRGEQDEAVDQAEALVLQHPDDPALHNVLGIAYTTVRNPDAARREFTAALSLDPKAGFVRTNLAKLDLRGGRLDEAEKGFQTALKANPKDLYALHGMANVALRRGQLNEAIGWLERARKKHPEVSGLDIQAARLYVQKQDYSRALEVIQPTFKAHPDDPAVLELLGVAHLLAKNYGPATDYLKRQASLMPKKVLVRIRLARAQELDGQPEAAITTLRQAATDHAGNIAIARALASLQLRQGDAKAAEQTARTLIEQTQGKGAGYLLLGDVYKGEDQGVEAADAYVKALNHAENTAQVREAYRRLSNIGRLEQALPPLRDWVVTHSSDHKARFYLASALQAEGQLDQASKEYLMLLREPGGAANPVLLNNMAGTQLLLGNSAEALKYAEQAHQAAPENPSITDTLGWVLLQHGDPARATPLLREAARKLPNDPEVNYHVAVAWAKQGKTAKAKSHLDKALSPGKPFPGEDEAKQLAEDLAKRKR